MTLVSKRSSPSNPTSPGPAKVVVRNGKILVADRKRVLTARKDAWVDQQLRLGPTEDRPGETFTLLGDEVVSIYHPDTNPGGVFDLVSDTPAVWAQPTSAPS